MLGRKANELTKHFQAEVARSADRPVKTKPNKANKSATFTYRTVALQGGPAQVRAIFDHLTEQDTTWVAGIPQGLPPVDGVPALADRTRDDLITLSPITMRADVGGKSKFTAANPDLAGYNWLWRVVHNLKDMIEAFTGFRQEVVTRRTKFLLNKARERSHVLCGLAVADFDKMVSSYMAAERVAVSVGNGIERGRSGGSCLFVSIHFFSRKHRHYSFISLFGLS